MTPEQEAFVAAHVERVRPLARALNHAWWNHATTGREEYAEEVARRSADIERIYARREDFLRLSGWRGESAGSRTSAPRPIEILYLEFLGSQKTAEEIDRETSLEREVESEFNNHRARLRGEAVTDNRIEDVLTREPDVDLRRDAWVASKEIGERVAGRVLELVRLRNRVARRIGYASHYHMALEQEELAQAEVLETMDRLADLTEEPYRAEKRALDAALAARFGIAPGDLRPWHYADPFFQRAPQVDGPGLDAFFEGRDLVDLAAQTFAGMGLEVGDILARSDLFSRPGKSQHAFSSHLDRETDDVRVLCNLETSERWMSTLLHELGHAVYDKHLDPGLPYLLRCPAHTLTTEATAMLFGRLASNPVWLGKVVGVPESRLAPAREQVSGFQRRSMLIFVRWAQVMVRFEQQLYEDPERDLSTLWWDLVERYQGVPRPEGRSAPDWASKLHLALAPVYYHNYVFGELMASQLAVALESPTAKGMLGNPATGEFLRERLFRPGASRSWRETLRHATGGPLDPRHFVAQYVIEVKS